MENLENILNEETDNKSELKGGKFWNLKLKELMKKYEKEEIKKYFDISDKQKITDLIGKKCFDDTNLSSLIIVAGPSRKNNFS